MALPREGATREQAQEVADIQARLLADDGLGKEDFALFMKLHPEFDYAAFRAKHDAKGSRPTATPERAPGAP